jgi:predicted phosphodiesterase
MKFQYISDLHLEFGNIIQLTPEAPNLILAGDIGNPGKKHYSMFIKDVASKFDLVFLVAGNHEYYTRTLEKTEKLIQSIVSAYPNVHYLQNEAYHFPNSTLSIYGTTLWSAIPITQARTVKKMMNDYTYINGFTVEINNTLHDKAIQTFENTRTMYPDKEWIVVCHHMPQTNLVDPMYKDSVLNCAFASDVDVFDMECVKAVAYGHTHTSGISGKYYCNPVGYPGENKKRNLSACFEVNEGYLIDGV